jgi:hypothetical protein
MPSVADQLAEFFKAPVLFVIALIFFTAVIWRLMEWRYRAVVDKMKELSELTRIEVEHWKDTAARSNTQIAEQVKSLQKETLPDDAKSVLDQLAHTTSRVSSELDELGKANSMVRVPIIREFMLPGSRRRVDLYVEPPSATQRTEGR